MTDSSQRIAQSERLQNVFNGWKFPVFALSTVIFLDVFMFGVFLIPKSTSFWGSMVEDFKVWCFGYNPATGQVEWSYVISMIVSSVILVATILLAWGGRIFQQSKQNLLSFLPHISAALLLVVSVSGVFVWVYRPAARSVDPTVFQAEQLRTTHQPPMFTLFNQDNKPTSLQEFRGKVVLLTGIYSTCGYTCPMILAQIKRVLSGLTDHQRQSLHVMAITLDPMKDTPTQLKSMADAHKVKAPLFNLLTGDNREVNRVLDLFNFARKRDPKTGIIDHVNLFILIDGKGKIAYRFTLGSQQEAWLGEAMRLLIQEATAASTPKPQS